MLPFRRAALGPADNAPPRVDSRAEVRQENLHKNEPLYIAGFVTAIALAVPGVTCRMPTTITVCTTCRQPRFRDCKDREPCGEAMLRAVRLAANDVDTVAVRGTACLMGCDHGCNVAVSDTGKLAYVLGSFVPGEEAATALVEYASAHAASESGLVPFRQWPQGVKGHFVARIPPLDPDEETPDLVSDRDID
jgi:predicted metal-binding protein